MSQQLALPIDFSRRATFGNFIAEEGNDQVLASLEDWIMGEVGGEPFYLWGPPGSGRSHLLAAACNLIQKRDQPLAFVPLADHRSLDTALLEGLESSTLVCLDDLSAVAGIDTWETALFHLFNRIRDKGHRLLMSANSSPLDIGCKLPDLKTRLAWGLAYHLAPLSEEGKRQLLQRQARDRGLELSESATDFLLARFPRDTQSLVNLIDRLDIAALAAKRRLTIPFLRSQIADLK